MGLAVLARGEVGQQLGRDAHSAVPSSLRDRPGYSGVPPPRNQTLALLSVGDGDDASPVAAERGMRHPEVALCISGGVSGQCPHLRPSPGIAT